jgi:restriction endonuclease S subunit
MLKTNFINVDTVKFKTSLPDASTVVTYAKDSTPLSFFTDDVWDFRKYISSYTPSTINQALCALIPNTHFNPEYTFFYIQFYRPYWMVNAMGGRKDPNINQQQIQDAYFLQPPIAEQNKIVDFLKKEHSRIDIFVLKQNKLIEKLKEYRSSIISHAVTGKIDVREFSA